VGVEKEPFLYYESSQLVAISLVFIFFSSGGRWYLHLLKHVTGVDTSTRPARRVGRPGKTVDSSIRRAAAPPYRSAFCWSTGIFVVLCGSTRHDGQVQRRGALAVLGRGGGGPLLF